MSDQRPSNEQVLQIARKHNQGGAGFMFKFDERALLQMLEEIATKSGSPVHMSCPDCASILQISDSALTFVRRADDSCRSPTDEPSVAPWSVAKQLADEIATVTMDQAEVYHFSIPRLARFAQELTRRAVQPPKTTQHSDSHLERFSAWLVKEMPAGTVIGDPLWWARKLLAGACVFADEAPDSSTVPPLVDASDIAYDDDARIDLADARRYQWLRTNFGSLVIHTDSDQVTLVETFQHGKQLDPSSVDRALDNARRSTTVTKSAATYDAPAPAPGEGETCPVCERSVIEDGVCSRCDYRPESGESDE